MNYVPEKQVIKEPETSGRSEHAIKVHGSVDLSFKKSGEITSLDKLYYHDPMKVLFPHAQKQDPITAAIVTTGGGLFGGDRYELDITLAENTEAVVTAQAAEKIYKTSGPDCLVNIDLNVDNEARLEWLPQETIVFDKARFRRKTCLNLMSNSQVLAGEFLVFGRLASGETLKEGLIREEWDISVDGQQVWADALHLEGDLQEVLNHPAAFNNAKAIATCIYYDLEAEGFVEEARDFLDENEKVRSAISFVNGILICRWLAEDPYVLRKAYGSFWTRMRQKTMGRADRLPRLWYC
ncbi:urease accessory protein UreD [Curvivirga sp.]|uniref:urease accessory protein UreD n=1 Tax=Curvivirga sp. TaxID=2856848 RepID=UPI003B5BEF67